MQSAGFLETRSHPPIQNLAKAPKLRCQAKHPHFVYSLLAPVVCPDCPSRVQDNKSSLKSDGQRCN